MLGSLGYFFPLFKHYPTAQVKGQPIGEAESGRLENEPVIVVFCRLLGLVRQLSLFSS